MELKEFKILICLSCLVVIVSLLSGAYLIDVPTEIIEPNGEIIQIFSSGDEFYNRLHDAAGYTILKGPDAYHYYAVREGDALVPSSYRVSQTDPAMTGLEPGLKISEQEYESRRSELYGTSREWLSISPSTGVINNIVIYIRFADQDEFTTTRQVFDARFNSLSSSSVRHYFREVSYDQMDIISHHFPVCDLSTNLSYQDPHPRNYYMPYHPVTNPIGYESGTGQQWQRVHTMFRNAIIAIRDQVSTALIVDSDNDGYLDNVTFIIRGNHASGTWLWPKMAWDNHYYNTSINNKLLWQFTLQSENMSSVYVLSHETFHTKGVQGTGKFAPDLYTGYGYTPVGEWDLMAHGFVHMGAWMKYKYSDQNWISSIPEITVSGTYTLNPLTSPTNNVYKIASPHADNQFFIVEYRKREGFYENNLPGSGLLVYRIFPSDHGNNCPARLEVYIYRPNGTVFNPASPSASNGQLNRAHFTANSSRASINDYLTNPTSFLRNGNVGGLSIYDVSEPGETISFKVHMELAPPPPTLRSPINGMPVDNFNNCLLEWNHVNAQSYSIEVWKLNPYLLIDSASNLTDQEYVIQVTLEQSTTYYWKVTAHNPHGSATSSTGYFVTTNGMPVGPSEPIRPENGDPETDRTGITFEWPGSPNAETYTFLLYRDSPYQEVINISSLPEPNYVYNASALEPQTLYIWMVSADNAFGSGWSPIWSFTTIAAPDPNEYWMSDDTVNFNTHDSRYFYDSLGPFGQYRNDENSTLTFNPTIPHAQMMCKFLLYDIEENFDYLKIYDGVDVSKPLIQTLDGISTGPVTYIANNPSGALTFRFSSNYTERRDGWTAVLSLIGAPQNLTFTTGDRFAILNWEGIGSPDGYNVYRNDVLITPTPLTGNTYSDYYLLNGNTYVYYVKGVYDGIESGPSQSVTVVPGIDTEIIIGTGTSSSIMPFNFIQSNSLTQQIYPNYLIGRQGTIEQITFFAASNYNNYTGQRHIKIWMGEVDDSYMDDEYWIPSNMYQLVFDGMIEFPVGPSIIEIPLSTHYEYNGGHLAIKAYRVYDPAGAAPPQYFYRSKCTWGIDEYKLAMVLMSNDQFDPENPPSDGHVYHTAIPDIRLTLNPSTSTDHIFDVGAGTELHNRLPVSLSNRTSLSQTIYPAHNFAFQGNIKGIRYYSNFTESLGDKQFRIWVGETGANNLSGGWISSNNLQLVFYGTVNLPAGTNTINIPFDTDYYYSGQNLVVMIERNFELFTYSDQNRFLTTATGLAAQSRYNYGNSVPLSHQNPTGGYITDAIPNTTFVFQLADEWVFEMGNRVHFSNLIPLKMDWRNSLSQTIYLANEINAPGSLMITGISYFNNFYESLFNKPVKIWMGETTQSDLTGGWIPASALDLVFDGTANFSGGQNAITFYLHNPYHYNNQNLVVMVQRADNDYYSVHNHFYYTPTAHNNRTIYIISNTPIDPDNPPPAADIFNYVPDTRLIFSTAEQELLHPPTNLTTESSQDYVRLSWQAAYGSREFAGYRIYRDFTPLSTQLVMGTSFDDHEITNGVSYTYYVTAVYSGGESIATNTIQAGILPVMTISHQKIDRVLSQSMVVTETIEIGNTGIGILNLTFNNDNVPWMNLSLLESSLQPGGTLLLEVVITTDDLEIGNYNQDIQIYTNDPASPQKLVRVFLTVTEGEFMISLGDGTIRMSQPVNMASQNSLSQAIYLASEIGYTGSLNSISYYSDFIQNIFNKPVKVWIGETNAPDLGGGWIPSTELQLVFDGVIDFPAGIHKITIPLQTPYQYSGNNLVTLVQRPMDTVYYNYANNFFTTWLYNGLADRARIVASNDVTLNPANPAGGTLTGFMVNTSFNFDLPIPQNLVAEPNYGFVNLGWDEVMNTDNISRSSDPGHDRVHLSPVGYRIYRDGEMITEEPVEGNIYQDYNIIPSTIYDYHVTALFEIGESKPSNSVQISVNPLISVNFWGFEKMMSVQQVSSDEYPLISNVGVADLFFTISLTEPSVRSGETRSISDLSLLPDKMIRSIRETDWLTISPSTGFIAPGEEPYFLLEYNTIGLDEGVYELMILIDSNDPIYPQMTLPVTLYAGTTPVTEVVIGSDAVLDHRLPINFNARSSLCQSLYLYNEINLNGSVNLTEISFYNTFFNNLTDKQVKIWVGETDNEDLSGGWIPSSMLTLAFDGLVDFPAGENRIDIPLQTAYEYHGGNLVVMVLRPMEMTIFSTENKFLNSYSNIDAASRYLFSHLSIDPEAPLGSGTLTQLRPNIRLTFALNWNPPLTTPANLLIGISAGSVVLSWDRVESATEYIVEASSIPAGSFEDISHTGVFVAEGNRIRWESPVSEPVRFYRVRAAQ